MLNILTIFNSVNAIDINSANIISGGDCGSLLIYRGIVVKAYYAQYTKDGISYPAYCLDKTKRESMIKYLIRYLYKNAISDVKLWRIIINGYPYKTIGELGCSNKEEAFTATKQAIYCYIHGNNPNDYRPIGRGWTTYIKCFKTNCTNAKNST